MYRFVIMYYTEKEYYHKPIQNGKYALIVYATNPQEATAIGSLMIKEDPMWNHHEDKLSKVFSCIHDNDYHRWMLDHS